ncbi:MAG TPA: CDP-diacylglycerol--glycerol-3-phosphate 3-phosphatidyltransferase [Candidatus Acidoferrales bacterium]|nr:CDP-diacylglycerol--glycerol-3-phosphate 3-phosphatidyltransferase [Candidatus Acidoferrales bacterium]
MSLPNWLTLSRLAAIPVLMVLLVSRWPGHDQLAALIFLLASLTDTLDGELARRRRQVSELGKFLDPLADKLFVLSVLVVLVQENLVAAWVVLVIFSRELLITILRSISAGQGRVIAATPWGKTKTVTQVGAVLLLILQRPYPEVVPAAHAAIAIAVLFTVWSGVDYLWRFRHVLARPAAAPPLSPSGGSPGAASPVDPLARELGEKLEASRRTLAVAESCTGGLLAALITDRPGASRYFKGGLVAYANEVKRGQLGVPARVLETKGAVSAEVARAMAEGARRRLQTDYAAAITGVAGPDAEGTDKPVGLTFIAVTGPVESRVRQYSFAGDRWQNRRQAALEALRLLLEEMDRA